jgi:uncharacterized membrane protein
LADVEKVLRQVAASNADVLGAEILWTPEDWAEVLTKKEVLADYPELRAMCYTHSLSIKNIKSSSQYTNQR